MNNKDVIELLLEELEYKKIFNANYQTMCDICYNNIEQDDEFIFLGNKKKVCMDCVEEIKEFLE